MGGGVTYQRLLSQGSQSQRPRGGGGGGGGGVRVRARAWVVLRWAAVRLSCCAARRRNWCGGGAGRARRLAWAGLCGRSGTAAAAAPERKGGGRRGAVAAGGGAGAGAGVVGYDSASYARNFDDGAWKAEEGVSAWAGPGPGGASSHFHPRASIGGGAAVNASAGGSVPFRAPSSTS